MTACAFFGFWQGSCGSRPPAGEKLVARVGNQYLSVEDLASAVPVEYADLFSQEQKLDFVRRWIDEEILYQNALKAVLHKRPDIKHRIEKLKKDILVSEMINTLVGQEMEISLEEIVQYYEEHKSDFNRKETVIKYLSILIPSRSDAWRIRNQVTKTNFIRLAKKHSLEPVQKIEDLKFHYRHGLPTRIADVAFGIKVGGTTPPIKADKGYIILRIVDKQNPGTQRTLEEVREEIRSMIMANHRRTLVEKQLEKWRQEMLIEFNPHLVPGNPMSKKKSNIVQKVTS